MLDLRGCSGFSLVAVNRGYSLVAVGRLLITLASFPAEYRLYDVRALIVVVLGLSSGNSRTLEQRVSHCGALA